MKTTGTKRKTITRLGFAVLLLFGQSFVAHAGAFKCTDSAGKTTYQAKPCPDTGKSEEVEIGEARVAPTVPAQTEQPDDAEESTIDRAAIAGVWVEETEDQTITLTISATGGYRWKVVFRGKDHSDLSGQWTLDGDTLILREKYLGTSRYKVIRLAGKEMTIHSYTMGMDFTNHFRKLF